MLRLSSYIVKCLWRHRARTLLTASGAAVAMFVYCCVGSLQEGLDRLTHGESAQRILIVFQENRFCPTSSRLPEDYGRRIAEIPGVKDVIPVQVWTNNCRASLDIVVFNGLPPGDLRRARDLTLLDGRWSDFESATDAAVVGRSVARRRGLQVGDQFAIGSISVKVAGIFRSSVPSEENLVYTSLEFLQYTHGLNAAGLVTQHEVHLTPDADPDRVAARIDETLRSGPVATRTRRKGAFQASTLSDLIDVIRFAHYVGVACVGLVLSLVATTTVMSVQDRVREHAVLQTLGVRPTRVFGIVIAESTLLCLAGGLAGTALALGVLASTGLAIGAEGVTIAFQPSLQLAATGLVLAFVVGIAAGLVPAIQAARAPIVASLREP